MPQEAYVYSFYPANMTLQEYIDAVLTDGLIVIREIDNAPLQDRERLQSSGTFFTKYNAQLGHTDVGSNGVNSILIYGDEAAASGFANLHNFYALVKSSGAKEGGSGPANAARNEIGGIIASMRMGEDDEGAEASFWGASFTLRGGWGGVEPGGMGGYTAVIQNHFDGPGSRFDHFGYAAVTWPGIGDGEDFQSGVSDPGEGSRFDPTFAIPFGFVVAGQSGPWPAGGGNGFDVGVQSGGWATPWRGDRGDGYELNRSRIGVGFRSLDWIENAVHVGLAHVDAGPAASAIAVDTLVEEGERPILARRVLTTAEVLVSEEPIVLSDGRVKAPNRLESDDAISSQTLAAAHASAIGTIADAATRHAFARTPITGSLLTVAPQTHTFMGPMTFPDAPPAGRYSIEDLEIDMGGPVVIVDGAVEVLLPGEYEVTVWAEWQNPSPTDRGTFRSLALMTTEEIGSYIKTLATSHLPQGLLAMGAFQQDAYQPTVRVRVDEGGKPLFGLVAHDASVSLTVKLSMLVRPVLVDEEAL